MIIDTKEFKKVSSVILTAVNTDSADILELKTKGKTLYLGVSNGEYYIKAKFLLDVEETFHATVSAILFLKLISQMTTKKLELSCNESYVLIKGNGDYKLPLIYTNDKLATLSKIRLENPTLELDVDGNKLVSILLSNSEELLKIGKIKNPVQCLYYLDQDGCITFTDGACVNNFMLPQPIKVLLQQDVVKLFKLFKDTSVKMVLGYDADKQGNIKTKVSFITESVELTALTPSNDILLEQVPVRSIRALSDKLYDYNITIGKQESVEAVNRLLLFVDKKEQDKAIGQFKFVPEKGILIKDSDSGRDNVEVIGVGTNNTGATEYTFNLVLVDLKHILESCSSDYLTINFGDKRAVVLVNGNVKYVIPERIQQ